MLRLGILTAILQLAVAQSSCGPKPSGSIRPSVASGYTYQVVATGLSKPRGISFDGDGHLLVVESGPGVVSAHTLNQDSNGCVSVASSRKATDALSLNHGIAISEDGKTLYASNTNETYSWAYNAQDQTTTTQQSIVGNMSGTDHSTRTLLLPKSAPGMLVVGFGSLSNLDVKATELDLGSASVKAFNLTNRTDVYSYQRDGLLLGWGLRNEVGIGEHPNSGGIWGVENSADQISRFGQDVHANNPGEELNFLGYLNGTSSPNQGTNFGYPWCFSAWRPSDLPQNAGINVGDQFALDPSTDLGNRNQTDDFCKQQTKARLVFEAHMAPLDIKFNNSGTEGWVTFHGSWDRDDPAGYKVSMVKFTSDGEPTEPSTSTTAAMDIFANSDNSVCPGACFRPVGMAMDGQGRVFVSSDASGEIYMITKNSASTGTPSTSSTGTGTSASPAVTQSGSASTVTTLSALFAVTLCLNLAFALL